MSNVLVVDDEASICWTLERALSEEGHCVTTAASAEEALDLVGKDRPDLVVMDIRLPGVDGLSALQELRSTLANTPVIIMTAFGSLETAVEAIHRGAFEYLTKPFDLDDAVELVRRALDSAAPSIPVAVHEPSDELLLGKSPAMQAVFRSIALVAERDLPVLISGESGTGKELVAAAIHRYSRRCEGPFVPVCVPALNESLIESELFGHAKGAFTGAEFERQGLLSSAHRGTAFFDEIGDISIPTQVKLLRVLETKSVTAVGSHLPRQSDFRLIAATNRPLEEMVAAEKFREDLFYRLNVFRITIPALRERKEDIPLLAQHFLNQASGHDAPVLSDRAIDELMSRPWYGNVRELRNVIEYAVVVTRSGKIGPENFPPAVSGMPANNRQEQSLHSAIEQWLTNKLNQSDDWETVDKLFDSFLSEVEPVLFNQTLHITNGNRTEAARLLGIHRQTLREKLKKYDSSVSSVER